MSFLTESVETLLGIGPVQRKNLEKLRIFSIQDLLFVSPIRLARQLDGSLSLSEVIRFRAMASLLEIRHMTPQIAEALVRGKIAAPADLRLKRHSEIKALLKANGASLAAEELAEMMVDAQVLACCGCITGKIVGRKREAVAKASVSCAGRVAQTDRMGRFRISRIPAANHYALLVSKEGAVPARYPRRRVEPQRVIPRTITLVYHAKKTRPEAFDEFAGSPLPSLAKPKYKVVTVEGLPRRLDLLIVHEVKERVVTLVSKFKSLREDEVLVHQWKVPVASFEDPPTKGDYYRTDRQGKLRKTRFSRSKLKLLAAAKKTLAAVRRRAQPETAMERQAHFENTNAMLVKNLRRSRP